MLYSRNDFRRSRREGDGADWQGDGDSNEALLCKQHYIRLRGGIWVPVAAVGTGRKKSGARRVSGPCSHDRFVALIMLLFLWSARAKNHYARDVCILQMDYCSSKRIHVCYIFYVIKQKLHH